MTPNLKTNNLVISSLVEARDAGFENGFNTAIGFVADELSRTEKSVHAALAQRDYDKAWTIAECVRSNVLAMKKGGDV